MLTVLQFYDLPRTMECLGSTSPHQRNQGRTHISPILMPIINRNIDGHWTGHGLLLFSRFIDIQRIHGYNLNTSVWHFGPIQNTLPWGNLLWFPKSGVNQSNGNQFKFSLLEKKNREKWSTNLRLPVGGLAYGIPENRYCFFPITILEKPLTFARGSINFP